MINGEKEEGIKYNGTLEIMMPDKGNKNKRPKLFKILIILLIIAFISLFIVVTTVLAYKINDLDNYIKGFQFNINNNTENSDDKYENIYKKLKEIEEKNYEENALVQRQINQIKKENEGLIKEISENIPIKLKEIEIKNYEDIELLKYQINKTKSENKELILEISGNFSTKLKEIEDKNYEDSTLIRKLINDTKTENKELTQEIFNSISLKLKEMEDKNCEENALIKKLINETKIEDEDLITEMSGKISLKLEEMKNKNYEEINLLKSQINKLNSHNKELKEQISQKDTKIQIGEYEVNFFNSNYTYMFDSTGHRSYTQHINFEEKYETIPKVIVSINSLDTDRDANLRVDVKAENIDNYGFDFTIITWYDSKIHSVRISWISFIKN